MTVGHDLFFFTSNDQRSNCRTLLITDSRDNDANLDVNSEHSALFESCWADSVSSMLANRPDFSFNRSLHSASSLSRFRIRFDLSDEDWADALNLFWDKSTKHYDFSCVSRFTQKQHLSMFTFNSETKEFNNSLEFFAILRCFSTTST